MDNIIRANNIYKCFNTQGSNNFFALKNVNIEIERGSLTILKGRSGSGKTTLMNILSGLDDPSVERPDGTKADASASQVWIEDREVSELSESEKESLRRNDIGFIFQAVALIPIMNGYENVDFALRLADYGAKESDPEAYRAERIKYALSKVGMKERMLHMPGQMSGGEQQRIAIARAFASSPKILFADEPTGALDTETGLKIMKLFRRLTDKEGISIIMTTHDPGMMELGDVVYEMEDGELIDRKQNN